VLSCLLPPKCGERSFTRCNGYWMCHNWPCNANRDKTGSVTLLPRLLHTDWLSSCFHRKYSPLVLVPDMFSNGTRTRIRIGRSLLIGHSCSNNILFTNFYNFKQNYIIVCFNFSSVFELLSILFFAIFMSYGGGQSPSAAPLKPPVPRLDINIA